MHEAMRYVVVPECTVGVYGTSGCAGVSNILRAIETSVLPACCSRNLLHSQRCDMSALQCSNDSAAAAGGEGQKGGLRPRRRDWFLAHLYVHKRPSTVIHESVCNAWIMCDNNMVLLRCCGQCERQHR